MNWTEPKPPTEGESYYDHVKCDSPLGEIRIEWKSWKDQPDYSVEIAREYIGTEYSLEDAKNAAVQYLTKIHSELTIILKL